MHVLQNKVPVVVQGEFKRRRAEEAKRQRGFAACREVTPEDVFIALVVVRVRLLDGRELIRGETVVSLPVSTEEDIRIEAIAQIRSDERQG